MPNKTEKNFQPPIYPNTGKKRISAKMKRPKKTLSTEALAIIGEPKGRIMIFCARKE